MPNKSLILYVPVIHQGYLDFFTSRQDIDQIYLISDKLVKKLSQFEPTIAALPAETVKSWLLALGFKDIQVLQEADLAQFKNQSVLLINDQVSRRLQKEYLADSKVEFASVFLRWDRNKVLSQDKFDGKTTTDDQHVTFMQQAYQFSEKSGDWWRQLGSLAVKDGQILLESYNQGMPDDHTPYQQGAVRDYLQPGEKPELSNTIHAEQSLIAQAAAEGISLKSSDLYVTHFPCPVCAKLITMAGIKRCFFAEGSSVLDGYQVMQSAGVEVIQVRGDFHE